MADLNEEITLSNGRHISLARQLHKHALLVKFAKKVANGSTSDQPSSHEPGHVAGPYITIGAFRRQIHVEATELLKELGISGQK